MVNFTTIQNSSNLCTQSTEFSVVKAATFNSGSPQTTTGYVRVQIDATALAAGDVMEVRVYTLTGGGILQPDDVATLKTGQLWSRDLGLMLGSWDVTVKITTATSRTIRFLVGQDTNDVNAATAGSSAVASIQSGLALAATALSTAQWTNALATALAAADFTRLDATVSSRAPSSTALSTAQWTNARAALLDNLDAAISSVLGRLPAALVGGRISSDVGSWLGTAAAAPTVAGIPKVEDATTQSRLTSTRAALLDNLSLIDLATSVVSSNVLAKLPAALDGSGNIKAAVQSLAGGALDSIFAYVIESGAPAGSQTFLQGVRAMWSVLLRKASGLAITTPGTEHFRNGADTKDVVVATLGSDGTRTVTVDGT